VRHDLAPPVRSEVVRLHRRQFVIGPRPYFARPDWISRPLNDSMHLSHCPDLRVGSARDADGASWVLLGRAVETLEDQLTECQRLGSKIQVDLLRKLAPDLLEFPSNPSDRELVWHHPVHACRRFVTRTFHKAPWRLRRAWRRVLR
jgi:hypothetical protein